MPQEKPVISIVTPTYNRGHLLPRLFQSIRQQGHEHFEWVVVDDGSIDNTCQVVRTFEAELRHRFKYLQLPKNQGVNAARNQGVRSSGGEWVLFVDSDDELFPEALEIIASRVNVDVNVGAMGFLALRLPENVIQGYRAFDETWSHVLIPRENLVLKRHIPGDMFWLVKKAVFKAGIWFPEWINGFERLFFSRLAQKWNVLAIRETIGIVHFEPDENHLSTEPWKKWPEAFGKGYETFIRENLDVLARYPQVLIGMSRSAISYYIHSHHYLKSLVLTLKATRWVLKSVGSWLFSRSP